MKKTAKPPDEESCSWEYLSEITGLAERTIRHMGGDGTIPKTDRGEYPKEKAIKALFLYFREASSGVTEEIKRDKARTTKAEATSAEARAMMDVGSAVLAADVEGLWEDAATRSRVVIETFPGLTELQREQIIAALASIKLSAEEEA